MSDTADRFAFLEPTFPDPGLIAADYSGIVERHQFANRGPLDRQFTEALASRIGGGVTAATVSNCTIGLLVAMRACFDQRRRFVVVPSFTFPAGPLAILWCGFEPIFIDVDASSWQPSPESARQALDDFGEDVAGILLCNTFGVANSDIDQWERLSDRYGVPLVIDSAAGFGSRYPWGEQLGARGACEVFSFHATKSLAIGEGGAVTTRNPDLGARIIRMSNFGFDDARECTLIGLNAKLPELNAAIGLRQLEVFDDVLRRRQEIFDRYRVGLEKYGCAIQPNAELSAICFVSSSVPSSSGRQKVLSAFREKRIEVQTYYDPPVHLQGLFVGAHSVGRLVSTTELSPRMLALPMRNSLSRAQVDWIVSTLSSLA